MFQGEEKLVPRITPLSERQPEKRKYIHRTETQKLRDEIKSLRMRANGMQTQLEELNIELTGIYRRLAEKMTELAKISG